MSTDSKKAAKFRKSAQRFAVSNKDHDSVYEIVIAGWCAMRQGEGLVFSEVQQILKQEMAIGYNMPNNRGGLDNCPDCERSILGACYGHGHR